jgi:hypothetical protein
MTPPHKYSSWTSKQGVAYRTHNTLYLGETCELNKLVHVITTVLMHQLNYTWSESLKDGLRLEYPSRSLKKKWLWRNMTPGIWSRVVSDMHTRPQSVGSQNNWASNNHVTWRNFPE